MHLHAIQAVRQITLKQWPEDFGMSVIADTSAHRALQDGETRVYLFRSGVIGFYEASPSLQSRVLARVQAEFPPVNHPAVE